MPPLPQLLPISQLQPQPAQTQVQSPTNATVGIDSIASIYCSDSTTATTGTSAITH